MASAKKILVLSGVYPCVKAADEAANVVVHELVRWLAVRGGFEVTFGCVSFENRHPKDEAQSDIRLLKAAGVRFLEPIVLKEPKRNRRLFGRIKAFVTADPRLLIRGAGQDAEITNSLGSYRPDAVLTIWSEVATAAASGLPYPKVTYYGNPDHKVLEARFRFEWQERRYGSLSQSVRAFPPFRWFWVSSVRRAHMKVMSKQTVIGDVAKNDAEFYRRAGLKQAFYINNVWPQSETDDFDLTRDQLEQTEPFKIVGNVGNLGATGNIHGIRNIAEDIMPRLRRVLGEGKFEIHLFGGGEIHPSLRALVSDSHIKVRGFVPDLDREMLSSPVFLVANNSSRFVVGHTRFLHAWSLACCVVGYGASAVAMPELRHGENALLGGDSEQVVMHILACMRDSGLRRRLGKQGQRTLATEFSPDKVGTQIGHWFDCATG